MKHIITILFLIFVATYVHCATQDHGSTTENIKAKAQEAVDNIKDAAHDAAAKAHLVEEEKSTIDKLKEKLHIGEKEEDEKGTVDKLKEKLNIGEKEEEPEKGTIDKLKEKLHIGENKAEDAAEDAKEKVEEEGHGTLHKIGEKIKDKLHLNERGLPDQAGETAGDVRQGLEHAEGAVTEGIHAATSASLKEKAGHAYQAVKEGLHLGGDVKDAAIDSQKTPAEGVKDAVKEGVNVGTTDGSLKDKIGDAVQFVKDEIKDSAQAIKDGLQGKGAKETAENIKAELNNATNSTDQSITDKIVDGLISVGDRIKAAAERIVGHGDNANTTAENEEL